MSGTDSIQQWQKMWSPKGCYNLSRRVVASSGQLRPAVASCGLLWLAVAGYKWLWRWLAHVAQRRTAHGHVNGRGGVVPRLTRRHAEARPCVTTCK